MTPPPRTAVSASDTPEAAAGRLVKRLAHWKALALLAAGAVTAIAGGVASAVHYDDSLVKKPAALDLSNRLGAVERHVDRLETGERWRDAALKGIADKLGVFVPDPPPALP